MSRSFIRKIKYKKDRVGLIVKDGKTYVKYKKTQRFRMSKNVKYILMSILILFIMGFGIKLLISEYASRPLAEEVGEGVGGGYR